MTFVKTVNLSNAGMVKAAQVRAALETFGGEGRKVLILSRDRSDNFAGIINGENKDASSNHSFTFRTAHSLAQIVNNCDVFSNTFSAVKTLMGEWCDKTGYEITDEAQRDAEVWGMYRKIRNVKNNPEWLNGNLLEEDMMLAWFLQQYDSNRRTLLDWDEYMADTVARFPEFVEKVAFFLSGFDEVVYIECEGEKELDHPSNRYATAFIACVNNVRKLSVLPVAHRVVQGGNPE